MSESEYSEIEKKLQERAKLLRGTDLVGAVLSLFQVIDQHHQIFLREMDKRIKKLEDVIRKDGQTKKAKLWRMAKKNVPGKHSSAAEWKEWNDWFDEDEGNDIKKTP